MAAVNLSSILSSVGSLVGSTSTTTASDLATTIVQNMAVGAIGAAGLAALQHPDVKSALLPFDPLNLAGKPTSLNPAPAPVAPAAPAAPAPKVIGLAQLAGLGLSVAQAQALGYTVQ